MTKQKRRRCTQQPEPGTRSHNCSVESGSTLPTPSPRRRRSIRLMAEPVNDGFLRLSDDLVEEVFLRLPPDDPACLVYASAVRKHWRRILADAGFRGRYREFHGTPPILGLFQKDTSFVPIANLLPALHSYRHRLGRATVALDCRHGRALFTLKNRPLRDVFDKGEPLYLTVFNPLTGHHPRVPTPDNSVPYFSAAVLCATQGCDHSGCQRGHFCVAMLTTDQYQGVTNGWLYSSENRTWNKLTSVHHPPNITEYTSHHHVPSVLVGDALYFNMDGVVKCDLGTLSLSMFERPTDAEGRLMTAEDGGLGFVAVTDVTNLTLWSMVTRADGGMGWAKLRVIVLSTLLPDGALPIPTTESKTESKYAISGIAEGSQIIFISTCDCILERYTCDCYMVNLKSGRVAKVSPPGRNFFPYMSFYMPAMEAASTGQGQ